MRLRAVKWLVMSVVTVSAFAMASATTEAEACCGLFQCLFGWCGGCRSRCSSPCGPAAGGCGTGNCGPGNCGPGGCSTSSYYGPVVYRGCAPCASGCSPCAVASAPCAAGDCYIGSSSSSSGAGTPIAPAPLPNDDWKNRKKPQNKTFDESSGSSSEGDLGASGRPAKSGAGSQLNQEDNSAFKKARTGEETDAKDDQGSLSPASKKNNASSKNGKKGPNTPKASDVEDPGSSHAPTISVDEKVAWRTFPARTRLETRPRTVSARIVRLPAYPKSDWLPVEGESTVAKK